MIQLEQPSTANEANHRVLMPVIICCCALMLATISAPEDWKSALYGTDTILPPKVLSLIKALARGGTLVVTCFLMLSVFRQTQTSAAIWRLTPIFLFCSLGIVSAAWSADRGTTISQSGSFTILMVVALLIASVWQSDKDTSFLLQYLSIAMLIGSCILIVLHFGKESLHVLTRSSSGIFHSTNAGAMASLAIVILIASLTIWDWSWSKKLIVPGLIIHGAVMVIGANRFSVGLACLLGAGIVILFAHRALIAGLAVAGSTVGIAYICLDPQLVLADDVVIGLASFTTQGQSQVQMAELSGRGEMWSIIWKSFLESPILGHGYFVTSKTGRLFVWYQWGNWTAHSLYLQSLATMGIVGTTFFFGGLGIIGCRLFALLNGQEELRKTAVFVLILGAWFAGWGILNESILGPLQPETIVFAIVLGIGCGATLKSKPDEVASQHSSEVAL